MFTDLNLQTAGGVLTLILVIFSYFLLRTPRVPLPPGPRSLPLIGNVHQLTGGHQAVTLYSWGREYGRIVYAKMFTRHVVVINTVEAAKELLEKRGVIYSDRPHFVQLIDMIGMDGSVPLLPYGNRFRKTRRWIHDSFSNSALLAYRARQRRETNVMLKGILARPNAFTSHFARFAAALIMDIAYGHVVTSDDDELVRLGERANFEIALAGSAGSMIVDFFPILKHYPTWLPGSSWKKSLLRTGKLLNKVYDIPYDAAKRQLTAGTARPSFTAKLVEKHLSSGQTTLAPQDDKDIRGAASSFYSAGTETMETAMQIWLFAMVLHPDIFLKAQAEMDRVVGTACLPGLEDRSDLPYLNAIIKETYRWNPPVPLGIPHSSMQEDGYEGYRIPRKTMIIGNLWGMSRDENVYADAEKFLPDRFLKEDQAMDPKSFVFGFGRRLCPGKEFADTCVFMVAANIVATMSLITPKDEYGRQIIPEARFIDGFASRPEEFVCSMTPRSKQALQLIQQQDTDDATFST